MVRFTDPDAEEKQPNNVNQTNANFDDFDGLVDVEDDD